MSTDQPAPLGNETVMTETVSSLRGTVRVSGHLTRHGADLLRGTVVTLHRGGHRRVVVDLGGLRSADAGSLGVLDEIEENLAQAGARLLVLPPPTGVLADA